MSRIGVALHEMNLTLYNTNTNTTMSAVFDFLTSQNVNYQDFEIEMRFD
jgi:hypothetical protein